ncbi:hypothetical protein [Deinococcus peraridilitoris]|uniref:hypothetical protein n=1 Tax=Deinococcus peraridilitoris TaxID=432329 RepID=UPI00030A59F7|nr:hypothetical protein [Deinococcus peraridilitoris]
MLLTACGFYAGRFLVTEVWYLGLAIAVSIVFSARANPSFTHRDRSVVLLVSAAAFALGLLNAPPV